MPKQQPDQHGFIPCKVYKYQGLKFQYQGALDDGRVQFSRLSDGEDLKMSIKLAKECFG